MATQGENSTNVFQELVPVISPLIGRHFTNVTSGLFGKRIITRQEISGIDSQPNLNDGQKGTKVAFLLYDKISESDDPVQCLLKICGVFESGTVNDASLRKHGADMRSKFTTRVSPTPSGQPTRVQPTTTPRASEDCSIPPNNDTPTATAISTKVLKMQGKVAQQPELKEAAYELGEKYNVLETAVLQSLINQKSNIDIAKQLIKRCVRKGGCESDPQLIKRINEIDNFPDLFDFLSQKNYISYLNYKILKRLSELIPQDDDLKKRVDDYETEYARFLNKIYCHELVDLFEEYDDLSPTGPVGLPYVTFHLATPWLHERFYTWITTFGKFSWSEYTFLTHLRKSSVIIKYAILPYVLDEAIQDLMDLSILAKLETDGITVVKLPAQEERDNNTTENPVAEFEAIPQKEEVEMASDDALVETMSKSQAKSWFEKAQETYRITTTSEEQDTATVADKEPQSLASQVEVYIGVAQETYELIINSHTAANEAVTTKIAQRLQFLRHLGQELLEFTREQERSFKRQKESYEEEVESLRTRDKAEHELEKRKWESMKNSLESQKESLMRDKNNSECTLRDAQSRKTNAESELRNARENLRREESKKTDAKVGGAFGGAILGFLVGGPVGAAVGAGVGFTGSTLITELRGKVDDAQRNVERCRSEFSSAEASLNSVRSSLQSVEGQLNSCQTSLNKMRKGAAESDSIHKKIGSIKNTLVFINDAIHLWSIFVNISQNATKQTSYLEEIIRITQMTRNYQLIASNGTRIAARSFMEAWQQFVKQQVPPITATSQRTLH